MHSRTQQVRTIKRLAEQESFFIYFKVVRCRVYLLGRYTFLNICKLYVNNENVLVEFSQQLLKGYEILFPASKKVFHYRILFFFVNIIASILCVCCMCHGKHREVKGESAGVSSLPLSHGSPGLNSDHQAWLQVPLITLFSCQPWNTFGF